METNCLANYALAVLQCHLLGELLYYSFFKTLSQRQTYLKFAKKKSRNEENELIKMIINKL